METENYVVYSSYISPNITIDEYTEYLVALKSKISKMKNGLKIIVVGDFNAKSSMWECPNEDRRGEILAEWATELEMWGESRPSREGRTVPSLM